MVLTHCGLVTPYRDIDLGQHDQVMACCLTSPSHYLSQCSLFITEVHHLKAISLKIPQPSTAKVNLKIIYWNIIQITQGSMNFVIWWVWDFFRFNDKPCYCLGTKGHGGHLNIKMGSYWYRNFPSKNKMVSQPSCLYDRNLHVKKTILYIATRTLLWLHPGHGLAGIILCIRAANERHYILKLSPIGWAHIKMIPGWPGARRSVKPLKLCGLCLKMQLETVRWSHNKIIYCAILYETLRD